MASDFFIKGNTIALRRLTLNDVDGNYDSWLNDQEITKYNSHGRFPISKESLMVYVKNSYSTKNSLILAIIDISQNFHIGNISLQNINWIDRNAEITFLLGERSYWGKGIMLEAGVLLIKHGFNSLNLHRIYCGTSSENIGMQKLAFKLGMKQEGIRQEAIFKEGKYYDIIEFGLINKYEVL